MCYIDSGYFAIFDLNLNLLSRFPKILSYIGKIFISRPCQAIVEEFIENGRLTVSDTLAEIEEHIKNETLENYSEREILEAIGALVKGQYIVQVDRASYSTELYNAAKVQAKPGD